MKYMTECAYCGKEMEWEQELFTKGEHGEPNCDECQKKGEES